MTQAGHRERNSVPRAPGNQLPAKDTTPMARIHGSKGDTTPGAEVSGHKPAWRLRSTDSKGKQLTGHAVMAVKELLPQRLPDSSCQPKDTTSMARIHGRRGDTTPGARIHSFAEGATGEFVVAPKKFDGPISSRLVGRQIGYSACQ